MSVPATVTNKKPQVAKRLVGYLIKKYENGAISRSEFDCKIIYKHKKMICVIGMAIMLKQVIKRLIVVIILQNVKE